IGCYTLLAGDAHHVPSQGRMPNHRADVESEPRPNEIEILAEAVPLERHARVEGRLLDVLYFAEHLDELAAAARMHRREAERAVADDNRCHAMLEARRRETVPAKLRIIMSVNVDEAWTQ